MVCQRSSARSFELGKCNAPAICKITRRMSSWLCGSKATTLMPIDSKRCVTREDRASKTKSGLSFTKASSCVSSRPPNFGKAFTRSGQLLYRSTPTSKSQALSSHTISPKEGNKVMTRCGAFSMTTTRPRSSVKVNGAVAFCANAFAASSSVPAEQAQQAKPANNGRTNLKAPFCMTLFLASS